MNPYALLDPAVALLHRLLVLVAAAVPAGGSGPRFAIALAVVTVAVRAALLPLAVRALRGRRARAALEPRLAVLRRRHAQDAQRLLTETARLHREAGVPLTAGIGTGLAQLPVLATVYRLVVVPTVAGSPNLLLSARLFGAPMAAHWPEVLAAAGTVSPASLALVLLLGGLLVLAALSARDVDRALPAAVPDRDGGSSRPATVGILRLLPYATVVVALVTPVAMGVYLLVSTAWTVAERRLLPRIVPA